MKLLVRASQDAGILQDAQEEVVLRVLNIGERRVTDIMTPRPEIDWIDANADRADMLDTIRACPHEQLLVGRGVADEPLGMLLKKDLLDRVLNGENPDPLEVIREPLLVHEAMSVFRLLKMFKQAPVRLAVVVDEYGSLQGIVTQTDLLEAIAGDLPDSEDESADITEREDGSLLLDGMTSAHDCSTALHSGIAPRERRLSYSCRIRPVPTRPSACVLRNVCGHLPHALGRERRLHHPSSCASGRVPRITSRRILDLAMTGES